jgi:hypothetical protein
MAEGGGVARDVASGADDNLATLEVARKLVAYLLAADRAVLAKDAAAAAAEARHE